MRPFSPSRWVKRLPARLYAQAPAAETDGDLGAVLSGIVLVSLVVSLLTAPVGSVLETRPTPSHDQADADAVIATACDGNRLTLDN
jgi:hypothetical protein